MRIFLAAALATGFATAAFADSPPMPSDAETKWRAEIEAANVAYAQRPTAILYANGACDEARVVLEQALDVTTATEARFDLWVMLLDLLRLTGQRDNFEALSLMFATEFERSPSAWQDLSVQDARTGEPKVQTVNLSGHLGGQAAAQFAQLIQIGMRNGALRIDLSRLRGVDNAGAGLLLRAVRGLRRAKVKLALTIRGRKLQFFYALEGQELQPIGPVLDASILSDECGGHQAHGSFTGAFVGVAASDLNGTAAPADFDYFVYRPVRHETDRYEI